MEVKLSLNIKKVSGTDEGFQYAAIRKRVKCKKKNNVPTIHWFCCADVYAPENSNSKQYLLKTVLQTLPGLVYPEKHSDLCSVPIANRKFG